MRPSYQQFLIAKGITDPHGQFCVCPQCMNMRREYRAYYDAHPYKPDTTTRAPTDDEVTEAVRTR